MQITVTYTVNAFSSITSVNCGTGNPVATYGSNIICVATVVRGAGSSTPTGTISWTTNGSGAFTPSSCALAGTDGTASCSATYTPGSVGSGSHLITASYPGDLSFFSSTGNQTVTVNKLAASVTLAEASKTYGDADPVLTGTLTGFLPADNVTATYSRTPGDTVVGGPYTISAALSPAGVLANYNITYNTANFTINKKDASVTPDTASKVLGQPEPPLTGTLTGFLPADNVTATYSRTPGETIEGSPYTISAALSSPAGVLDNYNITYSTANFTITAPTDEYTLTITIVGNGTVTKTPDEAVYHYGNVVTLSASANPGWGFESWGVGLSGNTNPGTVTIHGNTSITANFTPVPVAPSFASTPELSVNEDAQYTYNITVTDPNVGDTLVITAPTKPAWLTLTDNGNGTAVLTGTPTNNEVGTQAVVLHASDGTLSAEQPFNIVVANTNDAPLFTSTPVTSAVEDTVYTYNITVTDPDAGAVLTISAPTLPAWLTITDHGNGTATLTGTPTNSNVGIHNVTLRVNDTVVDVDQTFTIDVGNTNDGPSFTSTPVTSVNEDSLYTYNITASDPDAGNTLTITAPTLPSWLTLTDNGNGTATLTGTPTNNQVGDHPVALQVSDGVELASQPFTITVVNINDAPVLVQPVDQTSAKGDAISLQLSASDVDAGDILSYSAPGLPGGLSVDPASGLISGTVSGTTGVFPVTAEVNDGHGGTSSKTFNWTVTEPIQTLTVNKVGNGTVTPDKLPPYYLNDVVTLTAAADAGWTFSGWTDCTGTGNTCTVTMDSNKAVTATFTQDEYTLTIDVVGNGTVTKAPDQSTYHYGEVVTLTAAPDAGWILDHWSESVMGGQVTIIGNTTVLATFLEYVPVIILGQPVGTLTTWDGSFHWTGISQAGYYLLVVQTAGGTPVYTQWYSATDNCVALVCSVTPAETMYLANGNYQWSIQDYGSYGYGTSSAWQSFTLSISSPAVVVLGEPSGTLTSWDGSFHWTGIEGASWYRLEVQDAGGGTLLNTWYSAVENCASLACAVTPGLSLGNGVYHWRVQDYGAYGFGTDTALQDFTLEIAPKSAVLGQPLGAQAAWDHVFHWTGVSGATYYQLEVQNADGTVQHSQWYAADGNCAGQVCAVTPAETLNLGSGLYRWRILDYGAYGNGNWTGLQDFTIVLGQPAGTLTSWDHKFYWTGVSGASWYHLEVQDGVGSTVVSQWYAADASCVGLDCALTPAETANLGNGNYQWRIQDYGSYGYGTQTGWQSFTLDIFTGTVVLGQPSGSLTSWEEGSFHWTGIPSATWYHLEVQDGNGTTLLNTWYSVGTACVALECAVTPDGAASLPGGDYQWRVQYFSPISGYGDWTALQGFTLNLGPVNLVLGQPSGSLTSWDGSFHWTGIPSATWYHLEVQDGNGTTLLSPWYSVGTACVALECAATPDGAASLPGGDYQWRVQYFSPISGYGDWTALQEFSLDLTPAVVVLGQPSGSLTSWDGSFHWTGIPSATWYHLEVQDGSGTTLLNTWYSVGTTCTGSTCAVTPDETLALPDGDYQWRIQDYGSNGYGSWTQFQTFTLDRP